MSDFFWSPSAVRLYVSETDVAAEALGVDMSAALGAAKITQALFRAWDGDLRAWRAFARDSSSWTASTVDAAERFRATIQDYRRQLVAAGASVTRAPLSSSTTAGDWLASMTTPVIVALAAYVAWRMFGRST